MNWISQPQIFFENTTHHQFYDQYYLYGIFYCWTAYPNVWEGATMILVMHGYVRVLSCKPNMYVSWSESELRVRLAPWNPPVKYFYLPFQGGTSCVDHLWYLWLVFVMLSHQFIAALWSPAGKGLTSWLSFAMFNCVLSLSHVVSWVRCGPWLYRFLIFVPFLNLSPYHFQVYLYNNQF